MKCKCQSRRYVVMCWLDLPVPTVTCGVLNPFYGINLLDCSFCLLFSQFSPQDSGWLQSCQNRGQAFIQRGVEVGFVIRPWFEQGSTHD